MNAAALLGFLHKLKEVFIHYFNELEEESLRDNFVIAYELLDEVRLPQWLSIHTVASQDIGCHSPNPNRQWYFQVFVQQH